MVCVWLVDFPYMEVKDLVSSFVFICFGFQLVFMCCCFLLGREIFVGLSQRTNMAGAQEVANAFPEYPCSTVHVHHPAVHLKDYISMAGPEIMAVSKSKHAQRTFQVWIKTNPCFFCLSIALDPSKLTLCYK